MARAEVPQWTVGGSPIGPSPTAVTLKGKLAFHYVFPKGGTKYVSKCTVNAEGTISNSGFEGKGLDEVTEAEMNVSHFETIPPGLCTNSKPLCSGGGQQKIALGGFPWGSQLEPGLPVRDLLDVGVGVYCGGATMLSDTGLTTPLVKGNALKFDKGHGTLNSGMVITGSWKLSAEGGKVGAT